LFKDLIGDLSETRLYDLVKPLVDGKKSGLLAVKGPRIAEIYIEGGRIVQARADNRLGEEALPLLMDLDNGRVSFDWRTSPEVPNLEIPTETLMARWADQEGEWRKLKALVPSPQAVFSLVIDNNGQDRMIAGRHWGVLALCNGRHNVSEIAARLERTLFEVTALLRDLLREGLIQREELDLASGDARPVVDQAFFATAEQELKKVMGPIARIIINDTLAAFEETRESFPKDRVKSFISTLCDQVPDDAKREKFGKTMYVAWLSAVEPR
jgi:predicted transcriptional regulator